MSETERGKPISDERTLRDQLVAAGTAAAEEWLATRANRRMFDVNRKRLAGHVVNALWQQIEQATVEIAQWIAEDDRAELARVRTELAARIAAESADAAAGSYAGRAEQAEAEVERLRAKIKDDAYTAMLRQRKAVLEVMEERDQARAERNAATARAEQAEAALARLRAQLGESGIEWGVQHPLYGTDYIEGADNARVQCGQLNAGETGQPWRVVTRLAGQWGGENEPDATRLERYDDEPNADLDRLAAMQGVQPVTSIDQLTAPENERVSGEEWTAYAEALGIETGDEQGDGRDHTFEMLDDDAPKQNPRAVAEYWHEWADTCSNGGRDDEWTTVAQVTGRILAAMDGEQGEREGGGDE